MDEQDGGWRHRLIGDNDSWRRIIVYGVGAGVALALFGAVVAAAIGDDSDGGSLDPSTPLPIATSDAPVDTPVIIDTPVLSPTPPPVDVPPTEPPAPTVAPPPTQPPQPTEPPPPTAPPVDTPAT